MGNVNLNGAAVVHLKAGIYEVNSLTLTGNSKIIVDTGPVIVKIKGTGVTTPLDLAGGGVSNPSTGSAEAAIRLRRHWQHQDHRRYRYGGARLRAQRVGGPLPVPARISTVRS